MGFAIGTLLQSLRNLYGNAIRISFRMGFTIVRRSLSSRLISYRTGRVVNEVQLFCSNRRLLLTENCLPGKMVRVI